MNVRQLVLSIVAALALGTGACSKEPGASAKPEQQSAASEAKGHAPKEVKPGSHEDWCDEHQVPESQCTRCSPELVPAFKATGDWCAEHGVPESQCLKCNPNLKIVRPTKES
ncbi:hypothetical protein WMF11_25090 [Sorangium sp. So ce295]|uniref:hypothetical protein n=1 Tax=Sorangium sp. So ce295 TaxID=3133295 RepID=UPI003F5EC1BF